MNFWLITFHNTSTEPFTENFFYWKYEGLDMKAREIIFTINNYAIFMLSKYEKQNINAEY